MKILVTGGMGFIGSNFIRYIMSRYPSWEVVNLDKLTYAGNPDNLEEVATHPRYSFIQGDITHRETVKEVLSRGFDVIVNFAAESHVDRSLRDPAIFLETNAKGAQILLEEASQNHVGKFVQVSTDEVYGSLGTEGKFTEDSPLLPNSPYSASKAAADLMCRVWFHSYGFPVVVTRCGNNLGPFQFPEKLIPLAIIRALADQPIPIYGTGRNVRDWIYVEDHCRAVAMVIERGVPGEIYNIGANCERDNLGLVKRLLDIMEKPHSLISFVPDRPGHDQRYALDTTKIRESLGWECLYSFDDALELTVRWYQENQDWWRNIKRDHYL